MTGATAVVISATITAICNAPGNTSYRELVPWPSLVDGQFAVEGTALEEGSQCENGCPSGYFPLIIVQITVKFHFFIDTNSCAPIKIERFVVSPYWRG